MSGGKLYYGDTTYDIPTYGIKLDSTPKSIEQEKFEMQEEATRIQTQKDDALNKLRLEHSAFSPQGEAWSPNDSQFYNPDLIPGSDDTALLPKPSMMIILVGFGLILFLLKGK